MMRRTLGIVVIFCGLLLAALPALAHHSLNAEFQMGKPTELKGILIKVEWDIPTFIGTLRPRMQAAV